MPLAIVTTNLPADKFPRDFMKKLSDVLQKAFECNEALCMVELHPDALMLRAGTSDPLVNIQLHHSSDKVNDSTKREFGKAVAEFFVEQLSVDMERILVLFFDTRCTIKLETTTGDRHTTSL